MRKPTKRDRSFQPSAAGKGDSDRTTNAGEYRRNFDLIKWTKRGK